MPLFPKLAATLPGEADILARVLADMSDDTAKLVYADWLQERDDPRGPFLRECVMAYRNGTPYPADTKLRKTVQPWRDLCGITLMKKLCAGAPPDRRTEKILSLARPGLSFRRVRISDAKLPVGVTKFGGLPDLPPGAEWPTFDNTPLSFLAQFNFAELHVSPAARDLPAEGLLSLFCDPNVDGGVDYDEKGAWRLFDFPDVSNLTRAISGPEFTFPSCRVECTEFLTLPHPSGSPWDKVYNFTSDERDQFCDFVLPVQKTGDQLLGYPYPIEHDPLGKKTMRHLLTFDCGVRTMDWMGSGMMFFTSAEADLRARRFDRVRMEVQSV